VADLQAEIREAFRAGIDSASTGPAPITADTEGGRIFREAFREGLRADTTKDPTEYEYLPAQSMDGVR
jgi:hypothetical protein